MTTRRGRRPIGDERGSALLAALVFMLVMTILGVALFDLGVIENRAALADHTDARAFEIAQAGLERALDTLLQDILSEELTSNGPSWADGTPACSGGCAAAQFKALPLAANAFNGGTYAVTLKLVSVAEANGTPYSQTCVPDKLTPALCADLVLVRSTGTVTGPPAGYSRDRTIQALAKATQGSIFGGGITTGAPSGGPITGNVRIAGSMNILGAPVGTPAWTLGGTSGQQNNWSGLSVNVLDRLKPLQLVCPPGRTCSGSAGLVESLGASLRVAKPTDARAIDITSGSVTLGEAADSAPYGRGTAWNPSRKGKGPLDGIYVADGCIMPCTQTSAPIGSYTGRTGQIHVDDGNLTKPYPDNPPPSFPLLTDPATINGVAYAHYACPAGSACAGSADFFVSHAANLSLATLGGLNTTVGLKASSAPFRLALSFISRSGTPTAGEVCFRREALPALVRGGNLPPPNTLEFGLGAGPGAGCETPNNAQNPILVYLDTPFTITGGPINYRGTAIFLTTGLATIESVLQTAEFPVGCGPATECTRKFPRDDMLAVLATNDIVAGQASQSRPIMGLFYAGPPTPGSTLGEFRSAKQTQLVGSVMAYKFNFTSEVPQFYQVPADPGELPQEFMLGAAHWRVGLVPRFWVECRPGALPPAVTGVCGYQ